MNDCGLHLLRAGAQSLGPLGPCHVDEDPNHLQGLASAGAFGQCNGPEDAFSALLSERGGPSYSSILSIFYRRLGRLHWPLCEAMTLPDERCEGQWPAFVDICSLPPYYTSDCSAMMARYAVTKASKRAVYRPQRSHIYNFDPPVTLVNSYRHYSRRRALRDSQTRMQMPVFFDFVSEPMRPLAAPVQHRVDKTALDN